MANRKQFYLDQEVANAELNAAFAYLESADRALMTDQGFAGVMQNAVVVQHTGTPNLSVDVSGNAVVYDQLGERISWAATQTIDVSQDSSHVTTTVAGAGNEKWVAVFAVFARVLTDPRVDGASNTIFFDQVEGFTFLVTQGAEATIGTAPRPTLQSAAILLADVNITHGMTAVLNASIDTTRRQNIFDIAGSPLAIHTGTVKSAIASMLAATNAATSAALLIVNTYANAAALRAATPLATDLSIITAGAGGYGLYFYDAANTIADDGVSVIKPTSVGAGAGRWLSTVQGPSVVTYANVAALKAAIPDATRLAVIDGKGTYYYDPTSALADDSGGATGIAIGSSSTEVITAITTIKPTSVGGGNGRWLLQRGAGVTIFDYYEGAGSNVGSYGPAAGPSGSFVTNSGPVFPANSLRAGDIVDVEADILVTADATPSTIAGGFFYGSASGVEGSQRGPTVFHSVPAVSNLETLRVRGRYVAQSGDVGSIIAVQFFVQQSAGSANITVNLLSISAKVKRP